MSKVEYRRDIDGLRSIAVLAVVFFHAFPGKVPGGFVGVDVFFVISGYLISKSIFEDLAHGIFSIKAFYSRRIKRIFPALILVLSACLGFGWFALFADEYERLGKHVAGGMGFVANLLLWLEAGYFDVKAGTKPLLHLWSLGIEEQFYLIWPLLLYLAHHLRLNGLTVLILICGISYYLNILGMEVDPSATYYLPHTRFWELLIGALLAYVDLFHRESFNRVLGGTVFHSYPDTGRLTLGDVKSFIGLVLVAYSIYWFSEKTPFPGWRALVPTVGTFLIISAGPDAWINRNLLSSRWAVGVGLISYPLYLWHWPLLTFARIAESKVPSEIIRYAAIVVAFLLAWATYELVEKRIRFRKGQAVPITLVVVALILGSVGGVIYQRNGLVERHANTFLNGNVFEFPYRQICNPWTGIDYADDWCNGGKKSANASILVVGDSHSNAFTPMIAEAAAATNQDFIQLGRGSCPMLFGYGSNICHQLTDQVDPMILRDQNIKTVVMAARWPLYKNGFSRDPFFESPAAFKAAFEKTVNYYSKMGKRVVIFLTVPIEVNPRSCLRRPFRISPMKDCDLPLGKARISDGDYRALFDEILAKFPDVKVFDPWPYLCDEAECKVVDGTDILYSDETHLSEKGGRFLAKRAMEELKALLSQP